jgi:predicted metal-dependent HD superfamily phosphohydrolase
MRERSAELAVKRLSITKFPVVRIDSCKEQILATKSHLFSNNDDTNLLTDADLSVLGQPSDVYEQYCGQ